MELNSVVIFKDTPEVRLLRGIKPLPDEKNKIKVKEIEGESNDQRS